MTQSKVKKYQEKKWTLKEGLMYPYTWVRLISTFGYCGSKLLVRTVCGTTLVLCLLFGQLAFPKWILKLTSSLTTATTPPKKKKRIRFLNKSGNEITSCHTSQAREETYF